jgi:CDP-diglyceride synthetase
MAIVASYLLFIPARLIIRLEYGESEDDYCNENKKRFIYKFYHLRIFFALAFLAGFYFLTEKYILVLVILFILILAGFYFLCEMNILYTVILPSIMLILILITWYYSLSEKFILNSVILFFIIFISDCFAYNFTKCTHEPGVNNRIINKLVQKFDP